MSSNNNAGSTQEPVETTETDDQKLKQYADALNQLQTQIESSRTLAINHAKATLLFALKAGDVLRAAKKLAGHGNWEQSLSANVTGIKKSTAENYMRLSIKAEESKTQHVGFVEKANSLREAYIMVGIIKQKSKPDEPASNAPPAEKAMSPEEMKAKDEAQYDSKLNDARQKCISHVRGTIDAEKRLDWNLSTWTIKKNKACSGDETNYAAALFHSLREWVVKREYSSLVVEDENTHQDKHRLE